MHDALPRLDGAFDDASDGSERTGLDRRQLLKLGAWAAPVIVLATAAPAAAAASGPSPYTPAVITDGVKNNGAPNADSYNPGELQINSIQAYFNAGAFSAYAHDKFPTVVTFTWQVYVIDTATGAKVATLRDETLSAVSRDSWLSTTSPILRLPAGKYRVVSAISGIVYSPNPIAGVQFSTPPNSQSTDVTVR